MEISGKKSYPNVTAYIQNARNQKSGGKFDPAADSGEGKDRVNLSDRAVELQQATKNLKEVPDVRSEKVSRIKSRIDSGTYEIDGQKIALKIIRESLINDMA